MLVGGRTCFQVEYCKVFNGNGLCRRGQALYRDLLPAEPLCGGVFS